MKNLLAKFKIWNACDTGAPLSRFWHQRVAGSATLREFAQSARDLDDRLRRASGPGDREVPGELHADIMQTVRQAAGTAGDDRGKARPAWPIRVPGWAAASTVVLLVAAGWWAFNRPDSGRHTENVAAQLPGMWDLIEEVNTNAPALISRALAKPMDDLSNNARQTAEYLLASLPY